MATIIEACPHIDYDRTGRAYRCRACGMPLVLHTVPMTLGQVVEFEKMRRKRGETIRRRQGSGLILPGDVQ